MDSLSLGDSSNQVIGTCILSFKIKETIYSYDWVALIRFSFFNILVGIQVWVLHWPYLTLQTL